MCGIFGSPTITPSVQRMLPYLGIAMLSRGNDAWGASDGEQIIKRKGPLVDTWHDAAEQMEHWSQGIFHTRGASYGTPKEEENAHPFVFQKEDGTQVIGIHNGVVANHEELDKKYSRHCDVDSEHLWMNRAEGRGWDDIRGWGNLAWWEVVNGERRLHFLRFNADALKVAHLQNGEYIFASEMKPITMVAVMMGNPVQNWMSVDEYTHYWFQPEAEAPGGVRLWRGEKLDFARPPVVTAATTFTPASNCGGSRSHWHGGARYCYKCNTLRVTFEDEVLCFRCLREVLDTFVAEGGEAWRA